MFVETLDKCFENVCELDLIFHVDKVRGRGRMRIPHQVEYLVRFYLSLSTASVGGVMVSMLASSAIDHGFKP